MKTNKITLTVSLLTLTGTALSGIFAINKTIDKLATSKGLLDERKKETYHWRFGDICYNVCGEGKPVLLIHNLKTGSSSVEWSSIIPELSRTNTVYAVDMLGCGLSEHSNITYTSYMYTQLIIDFIQNVIRRKTHVVATGKSAAIVLDACSINENLFEDIVLINPENLRTLRKRPAKRTKTAEFFIKLPIIGNFIYHIDTSKKKIRETFERRYYYDTEKISDACIDFYYESAHLGNGNAKNLFRSLAGRYLNTDITRVLKETNKNIHILAGREITDIKGIIKEYQYYNPSIEAEYIDYTRELPQLEAPKEIMKYLNIYLYN